MKATLASVGIGIGIACALLATPALAEELDTFALGVHGNGGITMFGFPMPTGGVGVNARVRWNEWLSIEPHADAALGIFPMVGTVSAQVGVPLCAESGDGGLRTFIGAGPLVSWARFIGHVEEPVPVYTLVGGEIVGGVTKPLSGWLEGVAQVRGHFAAPFDPVAGTVAIFQVGVTGSVGARVTF